MAIENRKQNEIRRLTTPPKFNDSKAYDSRGNRINCIETLSDLKFIVEPNVDILTEDEIFSKIMSEVKISSKNPDDIGIYIYMHFLFRNSYNLFMENNINRGQQNQVGLWIRQ